MSITSARSHWNECLERHPRLARTVTLGRKAVLRFHLRGVEFMLACIAIVTGLWVGWPWKNYHYQSKSEIYTSLIDYMPSPAWTIIFVVPALPSIFLSERFKWHVVMRLFGMGALLSAWVLTTLLFVTDKSPYLATPWAFVFSIYQAWSMLVVWLRLDARELTFCATCPNPSSSP